jgi:hypothetical protein
MLKLFVFGLALASAPAFAHWHPHHNRGYHHRGFGNERSIGPARGYYHLNSRGASCEGARDMVGRRGAVIVYYGEDLYERVVRDGSFCSYDQETQPFWAGDDCFVGYTCVERDDGRAL